jgi:hypothetical protein
MIRNALNDKQKAILNQFIEDCKLNLADGFTYLNPWTFQPMDIVTADDLHDDHWIALNKADDIAEHSWETQMAIRYSDVNAYLRGMSKNK